MVVKQAPPRSKQVEGGDSLREGLAVNPPESETPARFHGVDTTATTDTEDPQIVILGVAGSSPVSHPFSSPIGSVSACVADIRRGEPNDVYHGDRTHRNCSSAKLALDSIPLYYARCVTRTLQPPTSDGLTFGQRLHDWFEQGDSILASWAVPPEETLTSTGLVGKEAKKWAETEVGPNATLVSPKDFAQLKGAIRAIRGNPAAVDLMERVVERELSVRWETADGHKLRCRFDALTSDGLVVDLKTTREADILADFWKSVLSFKYHFQDAWYRAGMEACGMEAAPLRFIVVSSVFPHDCQVVTLPAALVAEGKRLMDKVLADLRIREDLDWWLPETHGEVIELQFPASVLGRIS